MKENIERKRLTYSLAALLVGSLLFIFALGVNHSISLVLVQYIIAMLLYIVALISNYQGYKKSSQKINLYLVILSIVLIMLISYATFSILL